MSPFWPQRQRPAPAGWDENTRWLAAVDQARREYHDAQAYFEAVTERELVDQAIHLVAAAEQKLVYLTRCAREAGVGSLP